MFLNERRYKVRHRLDGCKGKFFDRGILSKLGLGKYFEFKAIDWCATGMKLVSHAPIDLLAHYTFAIADGSGKTVKVPGRVLWAQQVKLSASETKPTAWLAGVEFGDLSDRAQDHLEAAMKAYSRRDMTIRRSRVKRYYQNSTLN